MPRTKRGETILGPNSTIGIGDGVGCTQMG